MSFQPKSPGTGSDHAETLAGIIANSATVAVGELVKIDSSGFITNATASTACLGVVIGFRKLDGTPLAPSGYTAGTATSTDIQSVVAAADNQTVDKKLAIVQTSLDTKYSVNVSGTLGTTNSSPTATNGVIGGYVDVDSAGTNYARVLESTFERADGGDQNLIVWGVDPGDVTRWIVSICNSVRISSTN